MSDDNLDLIHDETGFIKTAFGGTELMMRRLYRDMPRDLLAKFQIIPTRVNALDGEKVRVLWIHDLPDDPSCAHLANGGWNNFHKIVFVSHWQQQQFIVKFSIPWSKTIVIHNAIEPIETPSDKWEKTPEKVNFVYHTTPHRGLEILIPVFKKLSETYGDKIHLNVFSSYSVYGWGERDEQYKNVFESMKGVSNITNHGGKSNEEIRKILPSQHIFAYPSIWPETSCLALMEAMSAGLICIHSSYGGLFETASNWTLLYDYQENPNQHASMCYKMAELTLKTIEEDPKLFVHKQLLQKQYIDSFYNWTIRKQQWLHVLNSLKDSDTAIPESENREEMFSYTS